MSIFRECFVFVSVIVLAQYAHGKDNFVDLNQLMELYGSGGPLSTIQWSAFRTFENDWMKISTSFKVKQSNKGVLNEFFNKMDLAKDEFNRATDTLVSKCSAATTFLPRQIKNNQLRTANMEINRFIAAFEGSKTHLDRTNDNLARALELLNKISPQLESSSDVKRFVITDFNNGTILFESLGDMYDDPETLQEVLNDLKAHPLTRENPVVYVQTRMKWNSFMSKSGSSKSSSQQLRDSSNVKAFFSRIENYKTKLVEIINKISTTNDKLTEVISNHVENDELPNEEAMEALIRKCLSYRTSHAL